jgi:septum formation protein
MNTQSHYRVLILASSSEYRKSLFERLRLPFEVRSPAVDETPHPDESAAELVSRLSREKAMQIANTYPASMVIGSDQLARLGDCIIGKPESTENAIVQLQQFSGKAVEFITAITVFCAESGFRKTATVATEVQFRKLEIDEISRYVEAENPLDCCGSFKSESLGISLFRSMSSADPTAIIGLPLMKLSEILRSAGYPIP